MLQTGAVGEGLPAWVVGSDDVCRGEADGRTAASALGWRAGGCGLLSCRCFLAFCGQPATATSPGLNGNLVVAAGFEGGIWLGHPDGTGSRQLTTGSPMTLPCGFAVRLARRLLQKQRGDGYDVWVINADGSNVRQLTDFPENTASFDPTSRPASPTCLRLREGLQLCRPVPGLTYDIRSIRSDGTGVDADPIRGMA